MGQNWDPYRDRQRDFPLGYCPVCGGEVYGSAYELVYEEAGKELCSLCQEKKKRKGEREMTLKELSVEYREQVRVIRARIRELEAALGETEDEKEKSQLENRIWILTAIWRDTRDQAVLMERYYERGYRRNARYTL